MATGSVENSAAGEGGETIAAVSSGLGRAGVAVIRLSGPATRFVLETISGSVGSPRLMRLANFRDPRSHLRIDRGLAVFFPAPASFTGEDVAEFHVHGGRAVISAMLTAILNSGSRVRLAGAGEFTRQAFENGKLDLPAVEALADLIDSETEWQRRQALRLMDGALAKRSATWRGRLVQALAHAEAEIDFSDQEDVGEGWTAQARIVAAELAAEIGEALQGAERGERIREGFEVVIIGAPNVGKSSLLNAIARRDVAIVSEIAGTTRDTIEVRCDLGGVPVTLVDTAGLRECGDPIEREGVRRAQERAARADLVLALRMAGEPAAPARPGELIHVGTKRDLDGETVDVDVSISTATGEGLDELLALIRERLASGESCEGVLVARTRQRLCLEEAQAALSAGALRREAELVAEELRQGIRALDRLIGRVDVEEVLGQIFAAFCIGK